MLAGSEVELLALESGDLQLQLGGLARAISTSKGTGAPGRAAVNLLEVGQLAEGLGVAEGHVDDAVVGEGGQRGNGSGLLAAAESAGRDEDASQLAEEATGRPLLAGLVPESLWES